MRIALLPDLVVGQEIMRFLLERFNQDVELIVTTKGSSFADEARSSGKRHLTWGQFRRVAKKRPAEFEGIEMGVLAWWPYIVKAPQIELFPKGYLNFHPSLLPYNRGKHPNFWAIVEQCPFGVTLHKIDSGIDTGPIIAQRPVAYDWTDTGATLYDKARRAIVALFKETYPKLRSDSLPTVEQPSDFGSFHHSSELDPASKLDLDKQHIARDLLNLLRARTFPGHPACCFEEDGDTYEVRVTINKVEK